MKARITLAACALAAALAACEMPEAPAQWREIDLTAAPVEFAPGRPDVTSAGPLQYRGGLALNSTATRFGGLSGLYVDASGGFVSVSDAGSWVSGDLVLDAERRLVGVRNTRIASMRDETGQPLRTKRDGDAEDITPLLDGRIAVSFEQNHRILIYDLLVQGPASPAARGPALGGRTIMGANEGLEGLATLSDGRLVGMAEYAPRDEGAPFWVLDPAATRETPIAGYAAIPPGFGVVGLTRLPNGDLLRLERFYLPLIGVRLQFRLIPGAALTGDAPRFDGPVIATLEPPIALDNFEALASLPNPDGSVRIYMLSDDNFSSNQRTLLYAFDYLPGVITAPAPAAAAAIPAPEGAAPAPPPEFAPAPLADPQSGSQAAGAAPALTPVALPTTTPPAAAPAAAPRTEPRAEPPRRPPPRPRPRPTPAPAPAQPLGPQP